MINVNNILIQMIFVNLCLCMYNKYCYQKLVLQMKFSGSVKEGYWVIIVMALGMLEIEVNSK